MIQDFSDFKVSRYYEETETANRADSGQLQFWSKPSEILNLTSSNTPETVAFNITLIPNIVGIYVLA